MDMKDIDIFELCKNDCRRYVYCESFVHIKGSKEDGWNIVDSQYNMTLFGFYDEDDLNTEILQMEDIDVEKEGWYEMKALFQIDTDCDDYTAWSMLYTTQVEFDFQITDEEMNKELNEDTSYINFNRKFIF